MSVAESPPDLDRTLHERFNLERFRPGQREVIEQVLAGRDVLCVMPTGGGKSLCYQLPAIVLPGVTLVVSPLIALMKDQVDALIARGIRATLINSSLELSEQNARMAEIELGRYDLVYVAPERFGSGKFIEMMKRVKPSLLAVDEAHCVSEWGHDFRPDYAKIGAARRALGMPPCIALTATATDLVRRDISVGLDLRDPNQFITGFDRPNLTYHANYLTKDAQKFQALSGVLKRNPGSAIVYASSRKKCVEVASYIKESLQRPVVIYHAGMEREQRSDSQERFMTGQSDIVVATNAFGMGVDKPDIRSVIHFNMPGTLEAYYQEAGRAGRDGHPSECVLLYAPGDRFLQEMFIENSYPPADSVHRIYEFLRGLDAEPIELTQAEISESANVTIHESGVGAALRILEDNDALERFRPRENMAIIRVHPGGNDAPISERVGSNAHVQKLVARAIEGLVNGRVGEAVYFQPDSFATTLGLDRTALTRALKNLTSEFPIDYVPPFRGNAIQIRDRSRKARDLKIDFRSLNDRKRMEYEKLDRMVGYAQSRECRRSIILGYFGDVDVTACGRCDNCGATGHLKTPAQTRLIDTPAGREVVQKILSGVARAKGNYGRVIVSQMLLGSGSEKMERFRLTTLSTYGILAKTGFTRKEVTDVIDSLIVAGLISSDETDGFNPVISLSELGWAWIRHPEPSPISLSLEPFLLQKVRNGGLEKLQSETIRESAAAVLPNPERVPDQNGEWLGEIAKTSNLPSATQEDPLWGTLRNLRLEWSKQAGVKAFQIFTNKVLDELVNVRPKTPFELGEIKGIGMATMERYGSALLQAIHPEGAVARPVAVQMAKTKAPKTSKKSAEVETVKVVVPPPKSETSPVASPSPASLPSASRPATEDWTWQLVERGFSLEDAAAIRGLELSAIVRHALWMIKKGRTFNLVHLIPTAVLSEWTKSAIDQEHAEAPPQSTDYDPFWPLFVEYVLSGPK